MATMRVRKEGTLLSSQPYCSVLYSQYREVVCNYCYTQPTLKSRHLCQDCEVVTYCSRACAEQDQDCHGLECDLLALAQPSTTTAWLVMKAWLRFNSELGGEVGEEVPGLSRRRTFLDLLTHEEDIRKSKKMMNNIQEHYRDLEQVLPSDLMPDHTEFVRLYGRVVINNFELITSSSGGESLGIALYLAPSVVDHSCEPNAWVEIRGRKLVMRSLVDRERLDMGQVFISYVDSEEPSTTVRRDYLSRHYFFTCQCNRCKEGDI